MSNSSAISKWASEVELRVYALERELLVLRRLYEDLKSKVGSEDERNPRRDPGRLNSDRTES